jgi:hypothetical protein
MSSVQGRLDDAREFVALGAGLQKCRPVGDVHGDRSAEPDEWGEFGEETSDADVLGSYTTFSSLMVSLVAIGSTGDWPLALLYLTASILIGFALAAAGLRLGSSEAHRRMPRGIDDAGETL